MIRSSAASNATCRLRKRSADMRPVIANHLVPGLATFGQTTRH